MQIVIGPDPIKYVHYHQATRFIHKSQLQKIVSQWAKSPKKQSLGSVFLKTWHCILSIYYLLYILKRTPSF